MDEQIKYVYNIKNRINQWNRLEKIILKYNLFNKLKGQPKIKKIPYVYIYKLNQLDKMKSLL